MDLQDEYIQISESATVQTLIFYDQFVDEEYLNRPTKKDIKWLLAYAKKKCASGLIGNLDCMQWTWKKNQQPYTWQWEYVGQKRIKFYFKRD